MTITLHAAPASARGDRTLCPSRYRRARGVWA